MKTFILITCFLSFISSAKAQVDSDAYYGNKYVAPRMGGGRVVNYDTIMPLDVLIKRLITPWEFTETYKAYWIGYTNDMYSIARYKDKAIERLTDFIDTSHSLHAREGALYTLHLIGINFRVVGRFSEDFENQKARKALLKYLDDTELNETVLLLIKRDPWLSDIPKLMSYLSVANRDCSKVLLILQRYEFEGKPLEQKVTDTIFEKVVSISGSDFIGLHSADMLISIQKALAPYFTIDKEIIESPEWQKALNTPTSKMPSRIKSSFNYLIRSTNTFSYCESNPSYDYIFKDHKVEVIGQNRARQIWLGWWQSLPQIEKDKLISSNHVN